jgi:hypothetical protein
VVLLVEDAEVEDEKRDDERGTEQPHPERLAEKDQGQEFHAAPSLV